MFLALSFAGLLVINFYFQRSEIEYTEQTGALATLSGIEDILEVNQTDLENLTASLQDEYIVKAQMAAYITQNMTQTTQEDYIELATLLAVDEIHIFSKEGEIYAGSEPKYWGYDFESGAQMEFFKPLLTDTSLTLCQDITPNTAEEKPMMYAATWEADGSNIVQIGIEPERILEAQRKNELSYIFASMPTDGHTTLLAVDAVSGTILGSSEESYVDVPVSSLGFSVDESCSNGEHFYAEVDGVSQFCVFTMYEQTYIGMLVEKSEIDTAVIEIMLFFAFCFLIAILLFHYGLMKLLDTLILRDVDLLIAQMGQITGGNLDITVDVGTSPEFRQLCYHVNEMVASLLNTTSKMSHVLDYVDTKIAVYEYKRDMNRVFATRKLGELLDITPEELQLLTSHKGLFEGKIRAVKTRGTDQQHVYSIDDKKFLKIETLEINDDEYGVVVDVSDVVNEKIRLEYERDYDVLTDLYNRRAFFREFDKLYGQRMLLKKAAILALDLDNLKAINDTYGHDGGDKAIKAATAILKQIPLQQRIIARMGGDEFTLVLYGAQSQEALLQQIQGLEKQLQVVSIDIDGQQVAIQMSAGYVFCQDNQLDYEELMKQADRALYQAKGQGKNRFKAYED